MLQNLFLSYGSYTCVTELILVFQILFLCEGTRRYDKSEHIRIIFRLIQFLMLIIDVCLFGFFHRTQTYTYSNFMLVQISRRSYRAYSCNCDLILVLRNSY